MPTKRRLISVGLAIAMLAGMAQFVIPAPARAEGGWTPGWCYRDEGIAVVVDYTGSPDPKEDWPDPRGYEVRCLLDGVINLYGYWTFDREVLRNAGFDFYPSDSDNWGWIDGSMGGKGWIWRINGILSGPAGWQGGIGTYEDGWSTSGTDYVSAQSGEEVARCTDINCFIFFTSRDAGDGYGPVRYPIVAPQFLDEGPYAGGDGPDMNPVPEAPNQTYHPDAGGNPNQGGTDQGYGPDFNHTGYQEQQPAQHGDGNYQQDSEQESTQEPSSTASTTPSATPSQSASTSASPSQSSKSSPTPSELYSERDSGPGEPVEQRSDDGTGWAIGIVVIAGLVAVAVWGVKRFKAKKE